ncbi:MAG: helix-turn-helix domain-containing protein [Candidatus Pacebacteria bacterium]|nr:helix-turn-helix domain-containing protein [Candidatus Paceibacterota bacterium]
MELSQLKEIGLSSEESKIYIACLELGTSKAAAISNRTNLPRTTIYGILSRLISLGFVSYVIKSGVKYFEAVDPEKLISKLNEKSYRFKLLIPELKKIKNSVTEKPKIEVYEGKEGIKSVYEDMLKINKPIYGYGTTKLLFNFLEFYIPNYIKRRAKLGIKFFIITEESEEARLMRKNDKKELRKTRFSNIIKNMATVTYIYNDKVAIIHISKQHPIGMIIENEDISKTQKIIFDHLWKIAK